MANIKVSVIIPVYNVEKYLRKCLDSVINQTLKDIEIICINDFSPDNSLEILNEYAKKDKRIKIINFAKNKGVSAARNAGIEKAIGEYIGFVDSDDYIDLNFYEKLYKIAVKTGAEVVKGNVKELSDGVKRNFYSDLHLKIHDNKIYFHCMFATAIYKKSFIDKHKMKFPEGCTYGEDRLLPLQASLLANKLELVDDAFYNYIRRDDSITLNEITIEKLNNLIVSTRLVFEFIDKAALSVDDYKIILDEFWTILFNIFKEFLSNSKGLANEEFVKLYDSIRHKRLIMNDYHKVLYFCLKNDELDNLEYHIKKDKDKKKRLIELRNNHVKI